MTDFPDVKLKAMVNFPATASGGTGIDISKSNGAYQIDLAYDEFAPPVTAVDDPAHQNALLWNDATGSYSLVPISFLGSGITPSNSNPLMDGAAHPGVAIPYSRYDHVHPSDTSRVAKAGDSMTGFLVLHADPDAAMKAATRQYVDAVSTNANSRVLRAGDTMTGALGVTIASGNALVLTGTSSATHTFGWSGTPGTYNASYTLDATGLKIGHNSGARNIEFQTASTTRLTIAASGAATFAVSAAGPTPAANNSSTLFATTAFVAGTVRTVKIQKFTAGGTYTPTAGMVYCIVECWGGGGAGGGTTGAASTTKIGAGGGAGGYSRSVITAATVGASKAVAIGAAGAVGAAGAAGGAGGATTFGSTIVTANGGSGGANTAFSQGPTAGGAAGTADIAITGAAAFSAGGDTSAAMTVGVGAHGAPSIVGGSGAGGLSNAGSTNGSSAIGYAAGGGGGSSNNSATTSVGGAGAPGLCVVTEFCSQ